MKTAPNTRSNVKPPPSETAEEHLTLLFSKKSVTDVRCLERRRYIKAGSPLQVRTPARMMHVWYLSRGRQVLFVDSQMRFLYPGEVLITLPGQTVGTGHYPGEKVILYTLQIPLADSNGWLARHPQDGQKLKSKLLGLEHKHFKGNSLMGKLLDQAIEEFQRPADPLQRLRLCHLMTSFLLEMVDCADRHEKYKQSDTISDIVFHIQQNLESNPTLEQLAELSHLSVSRFKARFKEETGFPPAEYILRRKIERAKQLLRLKELSITDIAFKLGFSSSQYFATVFKRFTNATPRDFQQHGG